MAEHTINPNTWEAAAGGSLWVQGVVAQNFNPNFWEAEQSDICELKDNLLILPKQFHKLETKHSNA